MTQYFSFQFHLKLLEVNQNFNKIYCFKICHIFNFITKKKTLRYSKLQKEVIGAQRTYKLGAKVWVKWRPTKYFIFDYLWISRVQFPLLKKV